MKIRYFCLLLSAVGLLFSSGGAAKAASWLDGGPDKLWTTTNNWQFGNNPYNSPVTIGNHIDAKNDTTLVNQFFEIDSLTLSNGADVVLSPDGGTTTHALQVHGQVLVGSFSDTSDSIITVYDSPTPLGASLSAETMQIGNGGRLRLDSVSDASPELAIVDIVDGVLDNIGGTEGGITGNGLIRLRDSLGVAPTTLLRNDSIITAGYINSLVFGTPPPASTLQITASSPQARFDWDGSFDAGTLQVNGNATLDIDVQPGENFNFDAFDGFMNLQTGSTIDIAHFWTFGVGSGIGSGEINVNTQTFAITPIGLDPAPGPAAHITGSNWTMAGGTINLNDSWDSLHFDSPVSASAGTIENSGTMTFNANATFLSGVDFNMNGGGASLVVNAAVSIATSDFNLGGTAQADNITTINSGGVLDLSLGSGADDNFNHTINLNGGELKISAASSNDWGLASNGDINAAGGGASKISGPTIPRISGNVNVTGNSSLSIETGTEFLSTADVFVEAGSEFKVGGSILENAYRGGSYTGGGVFRKGKSRIIQATTWSIATVDLDHGETVLEADLTINADSIEKIPGDGFDGFITIDNPATLTVNMSGGEWTADQSAAIAYNGNATTSTFLAGSKLNLNGSLEIYGTGRTLADLNIGSTGTVHVNDTGRRLELYGDTSIAAGATFTGGGSLYNAVGRTFQLLDGADVDIPIENDGTLALGNSPGQTSGLAFEQGAVGIWDLEVGGTGLNDFDFMTLSGTALLDGTLDLSLILDFAPTLGDTFSILTAAGGVSGVFSSILQPAAMPSDLIFDVNYVGSIVQLEVVNAPLLTADFDSDGDVDLDDLAQWQGDFGGPGSDADGDSDSDGVDFLAWQQQFGNGFSPPPPTVSSIPEPSTLLLAGLAASCGWLFPRQKKAIRRGR